VNRFPTVDWVVVFAGLYLKVRESGEWKGKRKLKQGEFPNPQGCPLQDGCGVPL
jgi:hypothetical protein